MMSAQSINSRIAEFLIRQAGPATKIANRAQMMALYALGIGGAANDPRVNGERLFIERLVGRGAVTVFDVGANRGSYAELVFDVLGAGAKVHCFEPAPDTFAVLKERLGRKAT